MLYKYMQSKYAKLFFHNGSIRIGTLMDFKKNHSSNEAIGDKNEGSHIVLMNTKEPLTNENITKEQENLIKDMFTLGPRGITCELNIRKEIKSPDRYVYCLSKEPSLKAMKSFDCDICLEISNVQAFLNLITRKIRNKSHIVAWQGDVKYIDKTYDFKLDSGISPSITKDLKFSYQKEYRVIWNPINIKSIDSELKPLIINVPDAKRYCRIIKL